eukprot:GEMP01071278.1.p1 GENE.GEMP01071278.1~~GEMP01071278.1.p1  ORF type:complete len:194 (+),score=22.56 GEMP01071278.1:159-740(+)
MGGKVVLLAAGIFAATAQTQLTHTCSRSIAREVRRKVDDDFVKGPLRVHGISDYVLPDNCPFKEQNDIWHYHESQKRRKRVNGQLTWECSICGKKFKSEHYLDVHMEAKHMNEATGNVCLANYCVVFDLCEDSRGKASQHRFKKELLRYDELPDKTGAQRTASCVARLDIPLDNRHFVHYRGDISSCSVLRRP